MLYTFVPNKPFGSLLEISPKKFFKNISFRISRNQNMVYRSK